MIKLLDLDPWTIDASCRTLPPAVADRFFFPDFHENYLNVARALCASCPVKVQCAALGTRQEYGMFGGLTPTDRFGSAAA